MSEAKAAFSDEIREDGDAETAIRNLCVWKRSKEWAKDGGQYIPQLCNWLRRGAWKAPPAQAAEGAVGFTMGAAEMENIQRLLKESNGDQ